jgi:hypothetical protein
MHLFDPIPIPQDADPTRQLRLHRLNCLGSLHYFIKVALMRKRLTRHFHLKICKSLESERIKLLMEIPRDFFKSTIASEGLPMWRALPISQRDVEEFTALGYPQEFLRYMLIIHDCTKRNLLVSETVTNAAKLGTKIRKHYESNAIYRTLFPETLPTAQNRWTDFSLEVNQPASAAPHGEGTFDFLGVGGAAQSRHYNGLIIQDDLPGRKAIESPSVMDKAIDYHQLVMSLYDKDDASHSGDELVIGNRWGYHDLNSHIREKEPWFTVENHSALGGCCDEHPFGVPIFPEEWDLDKLNEAKARYGAYKFSCQYLNSPVAPEDADFKDEYLNYFTLEQDHSDASVIVVHESANGLIRKDIPYRRLSVAMACDPTHTAGGRCRHAIVVLGISPEGNYYLLDTWAQSSSHEIFFNKIYAMAEKWRCKKVGFETCAGQSLALPHIKYLNTVRPWRINITELKGEVEGPDGEITTKKEWRIRNILGPIFEFGRFFMQRKQQDFLGEYTTFPRGRYCDQLDALAYAPQLLRTPMNAQVADAMLRQNKQMSRQIAQPYSVHTAAHSYGGYLSGGYGGLIGDALKGGRA